MKAKLLQYHLVNLVKLLSDGLYHDGMELGEELHLTRSGIWKLISKLKQYGIAIHSIKNKGYALLEPLILLDQVFMMPYLNEHRITLSLYEHLASTNDYLKQCFNSNDIQFCLTEMQTQGRGRLNRHWHSPFAQNIYLSCLYAFDRDLGDLAGLSLVVSLAIVRTAASYQLSKPLLVKWPNDVICDNKKLAGALVEIQAEANGISKAVIGIGINVNMLHDKNHDISQEWISLRELTGAYIDRNIFCVRFIDCLLSYLQKFSQFGFLAFLEEWQQFDGLKNKMVNLRSLQVDMRGEVKGVNEKGYLLLKKSSGQIKPFSSGEIEKIYL